jgi:hypothetical protein
MLPSNDNIGTSLMAHVGSKRLPHPTALHPLSMNILANNLSREPDRDEWQQNPRIFSYLQSAWRAHSIERFASMENTQLARFNAKWHDPRRV